MELSSPSYEFTKIAEINYIVHLNLQKWHTKLVNSRVVKILATLLMWLEENKHNMLVYDIYHKLFNLIKVFESFKDRYIGMELSLNVIKEIKDIYPWTCDQKIKFLYQVFH